MLFTRFGRLLSAPKSRQRLTGALLSLVAFALLLAGNLAAESLSFDIDLSGFDPPQELQEPGWGVLTAPRHPRLPGDIGEGCPPVFLQSSQNEPVDFIHTGLPCSRFKWPYSF